MIKSKGVSEEAGSPMKDKEYITVVTRFQLQAINGAEGILKDILRVGISSIDIDFLEELCYEIESLTGYYSPVVLRNFRRLFLLLHHANNPSIYPKIFSQINYLLVVIEKAKKYLQLRINKKIGPDMNSVIESHLGYYWRVQDFIEYKLYEDNAEIIQLSFYCKADNERMTFVDMAYWMNIKSGQIYYTRKLRPINAARFIKKNDTEFSVLQLDKLFIYPGTINKRIRWTKTERRNVNTSDLTSILEFAECNYSECIKRIKENFRDALAEQNLVMVLRLYNVYTNDGQLILEDAHGGLLTVMDLPDEEVNTTQLLHAILPTRPDNCALVVQVNNDIDSDLFSVKPLSLITSEQIIRLLF